MLKISRGERSRNLPKKERMKESSDTVADLINLLQNYKTDLDSKISRMT